MKRIFIFCLVIAFTLTTRTSKAQSEVTFYTSMGDFVAQIYDTLQPVTAGNFLSLVNAKFYDGVIFHRVINNFMIQGGDPTGTGYGGPGYSIPDEFNSLASNVQKALAMANSGPNTGGSQFFINLVSNLYLDDGYPVFGIVISDFSVVQDIGGVPTNSNDKPLVNVVMDSLRVTYDGSLGISDAKGQTLNFNIFPNPTNDNFTIDIGNDFLTRDNLTLEITNMLGEIIYTTTINQQQTTVDILSGNGRGIYFVHLRDKQSSIISVRKIVLQ